MRQAVGQLVAPRAVDLFKRVADFADAEAAERVLWCCRRLELVQIAKLQGHVLAVVHPDFRPRHAFASGGLVCGTGESACIA